MQICCKIRNRFSDIYLFVILLLFFLFLTVISVLLLKKKIVAVLIVQIHLCSETTFCFAICKPIIISHLFREPSSISLGIAIVQDLNVIQPGIVISISAGRLAVSLRHSRHLQGKDTIHLPVTALTARASRR